MTKLQQQILMKDKEDFVFVCRGGVCMCVCVSFLQGLYMVNRRRNQVKFTPAMKLKDAYSLEEKF